MHACMRCTFLNFATPRAAKCRSASKLCARLVSRRRHRLTLLSKARTRTFSGPQGRG
jgi:hypothetical protein